MSDIPGLTANIANQSFDLNRDQIRLNNYDLGMAQIDRLAQRTPLQVYGDTDLGFRMNPRYCDFSWTIKGSDLADYRDLRSELISVFIPRVDDPVQLVFDFVDRVRALDVVIDGELSWHDRAGRVEQVSGIFKASDPRLYNPTLITEIFDLAGSSGSNLGWAIPWPIPWGIGTDTLNLTKTINYADLSWLAAPEYPVIRVVGPISDFYIMNATTGEIIDLRSNGGLVLSSSAEWVEIDLSNAPRRDSKTIRDQDGVAVDQYLSTDSDLASWHLAPAGERLSTGAYATGQNNILVVGSSVDSETQVSLRYYDRYFAI